MTFSTSVKELAISSGMAIAVLGLVALATHAEVPAGGEVTVSSGEETPIYGARAACGESMPPSLEQVMQRVETMPEHGTLSDGGVGERYSGRCEGNVPIRILNYTAEAEYVGSDRMVVYGDTTDITVVAPGQ